jgi:hypothetical protein
MVNTRPTPAALIAELMHFATPGSRELVKEAAGFVVHFEAKVLDQCLPDDFSALRFLIL